MNIIIIIGLRHNSGIKLSNAPAYWCLVAYTHSATCAYTHAYTHVCTHTHIHTWREREKERKRERSGGEGEREREKTLLDCFCLANKPRVRALMRLTIIAMCTYTQSFNVILNDYCIIDIGHNF